MRRILADTGPLTALFDKSEPSHRKVTAYLQEFKGELVSTWPVLTEVSHMLDFNVGAQIDFLTWVTRGGLTIHNLTSEDLVKITALTKKYSDQPMDLADASLVLTGANLKIHHVLTLDSDFKVYRLPDGKAFTNVLTCQ